MSDVVVRPATPADAPALTALRSRAWRAAYTGIVPEHVLVETCETDYTGVFRAHVADGERIGARTWIAHRNGIHAGYAAAGPPRDEGERAGEVYAVYADPEAWGTGVGTALLRTASGFLAARGYREAMLWMFTENARARSFYQRAGWTQQGPERRSDRWGGTGEVSFRTGLPTIRRAIEEDADAIAAVHVRGWQVGYRDIIPDSHLDSLSVPQRAEAWRVVLRRDATLAAFVSERGGRIEGFVSGGPPRDDDVDVQTVGEVSALYVDPDAWGSILSDALLLAMMEELRARRYEAAMLWVLRENTRARRFYERHGWEADGAAKAEERRSFTLDEVRYRLDRLPGPTAGSARASAPRAARAFAPGSAAGSGRAGTPPASP